MVGGSRLGRAPLSRPPRTRLAAVFALGVPILLVVGTGSASATTVVLGPPYSHTSASSSSFHGPSTPKPCGSAIVTSPVRWHPQTGEVNWSERAHVLATGSCVNPRLCPVANSTCASTSLVLTLPIPSPLVSARHQIQLNWTESGAWSWNVSHGRCPAAVLAGGSGSQSCEIVLDEWAIWSASIINLTTGTAAYVQSESGGVPYQTEHVFWSHRESCSSFVCTNSTSHGGPLMGSHTVLAHGAVQFNGTLLNSTDSYAILLTLSSAVVLFELTAGSPWTASATGAVDFAGPGLGFVIPKVTEQ